VLIGKACGDAATWRPVEEANLDQEGFVHFFERVLLFSQRSS